MCSKVVPGKVNISIGKFLLAINIEVTNNRVWKARCLLSKYKKTSLHGLQLTVHMGEGSTQQNVWQEVQQYLVFDNFGQVILTNVWGKSKTNAECVNKISERVSPDWNQIWHLKFIFGDLQPVQTVGNKISEAIMKKNRA